MLHVTTQISIGCEILLYHQTTNSAKIYERHHLISMLHRFQCDAPLTQCTLANAIKLWTQVYIFETQEYNLPWKWWWEYMQNKSNLVSPHSNTVASQWLHTQMFSHTNQTHCMTEQQSNCVLKWPPGEKTYILYNTVYPTSKCFIPRYLHYIWCFWQQILAFCIRKHSSKDYQIK